MVTIHYSILDHGACRHPKSAKLSSQRPLLDLSTVKVTREQHMSLKSLYECVTVQLNRGERQKSTRRGKTRISPSMLAFGVCRQESRSFGEESVSNSGYRYKVLEVVHHVNLNMLLVHHEDPYEMLGMRSSVTSMFDFHFLCARVKHDHRFDTDEAAMSLEWIPLVGVHQSQNTVRALPVRRHAESGRIDTDFDHLRFAEGIRLRDERVALVSSLPCARNDRFLLTFLFDLHSSIFTSSDRSLWKIRQDKCRWIVVRTRLRHSRRLMVIRVAS